MSTLLPTETANPFKNFHREGVAIEESLADKAIVFDFAEPAPSEDMSQHWRGALIIEIRVLHAPTGQPATSASVCLTDSRTRTKRSGRTSAEEQRVGRGGRDWRVPAGSVLFVVSEQDYFEFEVVSLQRNSTGLTWLRHCWLNESISWPIAGGLKGLSTRVLLFDRKDKPPAAATILPKLPSGEVLDQAYIVSRGALLAGLNESGSIDLPAFEVKALVSRAVLVWVPGWVPQTLDLAFMENRGTVAPQFEKRIVAREITIRVHAPAPSDEIVREYRTRYWQAADHSYWNFADEVLQGLRSNLPGHAISAQRVYRMHPDLVRQFGRDLPRPEWDEQDYWYWLPWHLKDNDYVITIPAPSRFGLTVGRHWEAENKPHGTYFLYVDASDPGEAWAELFHNK